jgi:asparagine synthase (glutamine-hydrolysing)
MCGIAGYFGSGGKRDSLEPIGNTLKHRGPDGSGIYSNDEIGLVHTRLSIIDLSDAGAQPFQFSKWVLIFNGELYNYLEVRKELINSNYEFKTQTDTEVVIKAFDLWGEKAVDKFIGMFAFAIYNTESKTLWLFRDRIGVKPLYYAYENGTIYFASELKAFKHFNIRQDIDVDSLEYYLKFGFTPSNKSIYTNTKKLQAGTYLKIKNGALQLNSYWHIPPPQSSNKNESGIIEELHELLISACRYRMVSDVPVGVFLSGGIDSSLVTSILAKHHGKITTLNIGFNETEFNESVFAQQIADHLRVDFRSSTLTLQKAKVIFDQFYSIYDEPFSDTSGIPTSYIAAFAREIGVKVVLSADGGDELFAGYKHYQRTIQLYKRIKALPSLVNKSLVSVSKKLISSALRKSVIHLNFEHKLYAFEELLSAPDFGSFYKSVIANQSQDELTNLLTGISSDQHDGTPLSHDSLYEMRKWDLENYMTDDLLVKVDRATMYNQVECREPLLDHRLVEFAFKLPSSLHTKNKESKYLLKKILSQYIPKHYFNRSKQGFSIPIFKWFKSDLDQHFKYYFQEKLLDETGLFKTSEVLHELKKYEHYKTLGRDYNIEKLWRILSFMMWYQTHYKNA